MNQLKKYIKVILEGVIEEDYQSVAEIKELANDVLIELAKTNVEYAERQSNLAEYVDGINKFLPARLNPLYHAKPDKYPVLHDFMVKSNVIINLRPSRDENIKGDYSVVDGEYPAAAIRYINIYFTDSFAKNLAIEIRNITESRKLEYHDLYFTFFHPFYSTLMHEIQHAYDDFRSKSKAFRTKQSNEYRKNYFQSGQEIKFDEPEKEEKKHTAYLVQPHEVWARFIQAIHDTPFYTADFNNRNEMFKMRPINDVIRTFTIFMTGFKKLDAETQKRLIRKTVQFWHKEEERIKEKNKKISTKKSTENITESKKNKIEIVDEIHLPELTMKKSDLIKHLKELYNIDLKKD